MKRTIATLAAAVAMAAIVVAAIPSAAHSESLTSAISSASSRNAQLSKGQWNFAGEKEFVGQLDSVADKFHDSAAAGTKLTTSARSLIQLMERARKRYTDVLDSMQAEIIRIDGDLEAAQDSERWQQHELLSMRVLYRLNWIRYESAMRFETDTSKRKSLLKQAAQGFEEFMGSDNSSLTVEVLLGHGLASKAMRDYETATTDFTASLEIASAPAMIARLRIGLVEVYLTTKRGPQALAETRRLLAAKPRGDAAAQALFLRSKALLLALEREPAGKTRSNYVKECAGHLEALYEHGAYWEAKVVALVDAGNVNPDEWAGMSKSAFVSWLVADSLRRRDECDRALELYSGLLESDRFRAEALYGSGSCSFHSGRYPAALDHLGKYLEENPEGVHVEQSVYLRFKGAESIYIGAPEDERAAAGAKYIELLKVYLAEAPKHAQTYEAWFRLGDWHREHYEYIECAEAFEQVGKDTMLSLKAAYLSAQCYVEAVLGVPEEDLPPPDLVRTAVAALDAFLSDARSPQGTPGSDVTASLESKATVMAASIVTKSDVGTMQDRLDRLANFERDYGDDNELLPEVLSLRIVAYRSTGDLDGAGVQLERLLALDGAEAYRRDSLKKLGIVFLKEAAERDERNDTDGAMRSRRVALRVYERLLDDTRKAPSDREAGEPVAGLQKLVDDLRNQVDGSPSP